MSKEIEERESSGFGAAIKEAVMTIFWAIVIALCVRTVGWEPFNIPSGSMKPTLLVGDYLFVSKYRYGYSQYSLPWSLPLIEGRILADQPERGDVAVFKLPSDNQTDYIKRIVGLPGDRIQVKAGILWINGEPVKRERVREIVATDDRGLPWRVTEYIETLPNGLEHPIWEASDQSYADNTPIFKVPEGHYFAMGDNRDASLDSRAQGQVGYIPFENLVGEASFLFFSHDRDISLWQPWSWYSSIRFSRLARSVD